MNQLKTKQIAKENDRFRQCGCNVQDVGKIIIAPGVNGPQMSAIIAKMMVYEEFNAESDPFEQHDFGVIHHDGGEYFWKIDYYDPDYEYGADPYEDDKPMRRVLTLMTSEEY